MPEQVVSAVAEAFEMTPQVVLHRSHQLAFKVAVYLIAPEEYEQLWSFPQFTQSDRDPYT